MVTITDDEISVSGETMAQAKRALAKAKRAQAKQTKADDMEREIAGNVAYTIIGNLCCTAWDGCNRDGSLPCGYRRIRAEDPHCPIRLTGRELSQRDYTISLPDGNATFWLYNADVREVLCNGADWPLLVKTQCESGESVWYAIGHYKDKISCTRIPTVLATVVDGTKLLEV